MSNSRNLADLDIDAGGLLPSASMAAGAAVSNIGYTPVNNAGDTMTGALTATGFTGPLTGNAATATNVAYSGLTGTVPTWNQDTTGNAATATTTTGNAATSTALATGRTIALTGDVTYTSPSFNGSANVTAAATLANSGVTAGTYGSASAIPAITVDAKGRVTSVTTNAVSGGVSSLNGQTGAITDTNLYAIGSYVVGRPANQTQYAANSTIAGSSLYGTDTCTFRFISGGVWKNNVSGADVSSPALINTGTWRAMSVAGAIDGNYGFPGLWVRIS